MIIKQRLHGYLKIDEERAIKIIKDENIKEIQFVEKEDISGQIILYATSFIKDKRTSKLIVNDKGYRTILPWKLRPFIGKDIFLYHDNIEYEPGEIFRIKPINFSLGKNRIKEVFKVNPYFTGKGSFIIPFIYINDLLDEKACMMRVSFNSLTSAMLENGRIEARLMIGRDSGGFNYPLYPCSTGLCTKTMVKFIDFVYEINKSLENFKYEGTYADINKYGVIRFNER